MTELLAQSDAYLKQFDATVTAVTGDQVSLDRTAFYPRGGGQPSDQGVLRVGGDEYKVLEVKKQAGYSGPSQRTEGANSTENPRRDVAEVWHKLDRAAAFAVGVQVHGVIDWERRYKLMRTHTALHILCGTMFRDYGVSVTGGDMEPLAARMDFELERMSADFAHDVEEKVNLEIAAARDIRVKVLPREEAFAIPDLIRTKINLLPPDIKEVRTVEIVGLDLQADGGTHVANTREVGRIKVVGHESKGKINKRLRIVVE
jgi:misacylated tRNA(Ala) deacylase